MSLTQANPDADAQREISAAVLSVCLVLSITLHVGAFWDGWSDLLPATTEPAPGETPQPKPIQKPIRKLGRENEPQRTTLTWVAWDDFQKVIATRARSDQPAVQQKAEPVKRAPFRLDASLASAASRAQQPPQRTPSPSKADRASHQPSPPTSPSPATPLVLPDVKQPVLPRSPVKPEKTAPPSEQASRPREVEPVAQAPPIAPPTAPPTPPTKPSPKPANKPTADHAEKNKPTSAPRSDFEVTPTSTVALPKHRIGGTIVSQGLEVKTVLPRLSVGANFVVPRNPTVIIVFDQEGEVIRAGFKDRKSTTGHPVWDAPLRASLYLWRAKGERLKRSRQTVLLMEIDFRPKE